MSSNPEKYEHDLISPESGTVCFLSHKLSKEFPIVPDQFFRIEVPDPIMIDFPNADSFQKEYVGAYEETKNFLQARIERTQYIAREEASGIAHKLMQNIGTPKADGTRQHVLCYDDFSIMPFDFVQFTCAPRLTLYDASWQHLTIWKENIFLKAGKVDIDQILFCYNRQYFRCIRPSFYDLKYSVDGKKWSYIGRSFYGTPDVTSFRKEALAEKKQNIGKHKRAQKNRSQTHIKTKFYLPMAVYSDLESGMASIRDSNSIDFTCAMEEIFGPQSVSQE